MLLTPGLTTHQAQTLRHCLLSLSGVPEAAAVSLYMDADRCAGRALNVYRPGEDIGDATSAIAVLADGHSTDLAVVSYVAGMAFGVRLGKSFAPPPPKRAKQWISEEYRQLSETNRREVAQLIRLLLRDQAPAVGTVAARRAQR